MKKPTCITFAGPYGSSKSPIAQYLSCELGWPRLENDVIRKEIKEDTLKPELDLDMCADRIVGRIQALAARKINFVYDASNDRHWTKFLENFEPDSYRIGVISIDLSEAFYRRLITAKQYGLSEEQIQTYLTDHAQFLRQFADTVICRIDDKNFDRRLQIAKEATDQFLSST